MASIGEHLDNMVVTVSSPDGRIHARVSNYHDTQVSFDPGAYERYDEDTLAYQLARLGVLTWVAYHRGRTEAYRVSRRLAMDEVAAAERLGDNPHRQRYEEELNEIEGEGVSTAGAVRIRTRGMMQWSVEITFGALRRLDESTFVSELHSAMKSLLNDREVKIITLKSDYFDIGIPRKWRDVMAELRAINRKRR